MAPGREGAGVPGAAAGVAGRAAGPRGAAGPGGAAPGAPAAFDAGAPDAGMDGLCAHAADADSWTSRQRSVGIAAHRVVLVIISVIAVPRSWPHSYQRIVIPPAT